MAPLNQAHRGRRGIALVEIAIVLPLLFALLCGLLEYGWLFYKQQQISSVARSACRFGITQPATGPQTEAKIQSLMAESGFVKLPGDEWSCSMSTVAGSPVTVLIEVSYDNNLELIGFPLIPVPDKLIGKMTMAKEGPP